MAKSFTEEVGADSLRATVWQEALQRHQGNIAKASDEFGFSKQRGHSLTKHLSLVDFARDLRVKAGQPVTGRPKKPDNRKRKKEGV